MVVETPTMQLDRPEAKDPCRRCRHKRAMHAGDDGKGRCLGFVDEPGAPPCTCRRFRPVGWLRRLLRRGGPR